jgi:hypothetical protein
MQPPAIFFSYSERVAEPSSVRIVQRKLRQLVESELGWRVIDPMDRPDHRSVELKVRDGLLRSDSILLDCTNNPNVALEAGFAKAFSYPLFVIKQKSSEMLPADFGDIEYTEYPDQIENDTDLDPFLEQIRRLLRTAEGTDLLPALRKMRMSVKQICLEAAALYDPLASRTTTLAMIAGYLGAVAQDVLRRAKTDFRVSSQHYLSCLAAAGELAEEPPAGRAIADLTNSIEKWDRFIPALWAGIRERIFHVAWEDLFDPGRFASVISELARHGRHGGSYRLFLVTTRESSEVLARIPHPLGVDATGLHLLLLDPGSVGGYSGTADNPQFVLKYVSSSNYAAASSFFQRLRDAAIEIEPGNEKAVRTRWLQLHGIGKWEPHWTAEVEERDSRYFDDYDRHIRCWIPYYSELIRHCAIRVQLEIVRLCRKLDVPLNLLELGVGTGALTFEVADWAANLNRPFARVGEHQMGDMDPRPIATYVGVDRAARMIRETVRRTGSISREELNLRVVTKPFGLQTEREATERYHIVFGTLILHFLLGPAPSRAQLERWLGRLVDEWLNPMGSLVFADIAFAGSRKTQIAWWKRWMREGGLDPRWVEDFAEGNKDMLRAPTTKLLESVARSIGLNVTVTPIGRLDNPFVVVVMRRNKEPETRSLDAT